MRVLVGCEYSNTVSQAFRDKGHTVWSCDKDPTEGPLEWHEQCDIFDMFGRIWDLIILHPPCTAIANCGNGTYGRGKPRHQERIDAVEWTTHLFNEAKRYSKHVCLENPKSIIWKYLGYKPQYVQPHNFGHKEVKMTGFALHELPDLIPTDEVGPPPPLGSEERKSWERIWRMAPSEDRGKERSRFYPGIAKAMADQWG